MALSSPESRAPMLSEPQPEEPPERGELQFVCDACGEAFAGVPGGAGLFIWTRGDEVRFEEPPLCEDCAERVALGALIKWSGESEEEG